MQLLIDLLTSKLKQNTAITAEDLSIATYGINIAINTLISTIGLLIVGVILHEVQSAFIIIFVFYLNQTFGGGFHATTHTQCFLFMLFWITLALLIIHKSIVTITALFFFDIVSFAIMFSFPVILHPNRAFLANKLSLYKKRMHIILFGEIITCFILKQDKPLVAFSLGLVISAISKLIAYLQRSGYNN